VTADRLLWRELSRPGPLGEPRSSSSNRTLSSLGMSGSACSDVESRRASAARRAATSAHDSDHVGEQSPLGRSADSRECAKWVSMSLRPRSRSTWCAVGNRHRRPGALSWRITFNRSRCGFLRGADGNVSDVVRVVILAHERRHIVHVAVTPTHGRWTAQQLREAFPWDNAPPYLVHDHDTAFHAWATTADGDGYPRSPDGHSLTVAERYAERVIRSIAGNASITSRRQRARLRRVLDAYVEYYLKSRTPLSLDKDARSLDESNHATRRRRGDSTAGGLHHRYRAPAPSSRTRPDPDSTIPQRVGQRPVPGTFEGFVDHAERRAGGVRCDQVGRRAVS